MIQQLLPIATARCSRTSFKAMFSKGCRRNGQASQAGGGDRYPQPLSLHPTVCDLSNLKPMVYQSGLSPACNNLGVNPKGRFSPVEDIRALELKTRDPNRMEDGYLSQRCSVCHGDSASSLGCHPVRVS